MAQCQKRVTEKNNIFKVTVSPKPIHSPPVKTPVIKQVSEIQEQTEECNDLLALAFQSLPLLTDKQCSHLPCKIYHIAL